MLFAEGKSRCKIHMYLFGKIRYRGVHYAEILKAFTLRTDFLFKLAQTRTAVILADFKLSCGYLRQHLLKRIAELLYEVDLALFIHGNNADTAGVDNKLTGNYCTVFKLCLILAYFYDPAVKDRLCFNCFFLKMHSKTLLYKATNVLLKIIAHLFDFFKGLGKFFL